MSILVTHASKHGATAQIAERIAGTLQAAGLDVEVKPIKEVDNLAGYDAFVVGSAVYFGSWMKEAAQFVRRNQALLATRPVWLFSSGPLGTSATDDRGRDLREVSIPEETAAFKDAIHPRDHRVFFGALDPARLAFTHRLIRTLPAGRTLLPEGDFRDWADVETWAAGIAHDLAPVPAGGRQSGT
jgi:menaquinone-dependent protoporphyrinogen oxidase